MAIAKPLREAIPFALVIVLAVFYLLEWRHARLRMEVRDLALRGELAGLRSTLLAETLRTNSAVRGLAQEVQSVGRRIARAQSSPDVQEGLQMVATVAPEEAETSPAGEAQESLPPLPPRVSDPVRFVRGLDPERFYADPEFNPAARELGNMEKLRAGCEISIARSRIDILEKEIQKICAENIDRLRAEGAFVEYEKGQPPDPSGPGVVTFGEVTERGSTRVYYFYPEEYPEIHEKRAEERVVGEMCVRRLLGIAEGESGEEGGSR